MCHQPSFNPCFNLQKFAASSLDSTLSAMSSALKCSHSGSVCMVFTTLPITAINSTGLRIHPLWTLTIMSCSLFKPASVFTVVSVQLCVAIASRMACSVFTVVYVQLCVAIASHMTYSVFTVVCSTVCSNRQPYDVLCCFLWYVFIELHWAKFYQKIFLDK